jgi:hypothetical protein
MMNEVTSVTILACPFLEKCIAHFGLVRVVYVHVDSQLMGTMSELTFLTIWAATFLCEIFA